MQIPLLVPVQAPDAQGVWTEKLKGVQIEEQSLRGTGPHRFNGRGQAGGVEGNSPLGCEKIGCGDSYW